jgi:hypothetical protein
MGSTRRSVIPRATTSDSPRRPGRRWRSSRHRSGNRSGNV